MINTSTFSVSFMMKIITLVYIFRVQSIVFSYTKDMTRN